MLIVGSNNIVTVPAYRLAIRPESSLGNLGPDHTPSPRPWPATVVLTTLQPLPPSRNTKKLPRFHRGWSRSLLFPPPNVGSPDRARSPKATRRGEVRVLPLTPPKQLSEPRRHAAESSPSLNGEGSTTSTVE